MLMLVRIKLVYSRLIIMLLYFLSNALLIILKFSFLQVKI